MHKKFYPVLRVGGKCAKRSNPRNSHFVAPPLPVIKNQSLTSSSNISIDLQEDANVLQFGWENGAQTIDYPQAASNTRLVGAFMARIARALNTKRGTDPMTMWCIGHSLGGHLCGHAGARFKLGRITGQYPQIPYIRRRCIPIHCLCDACLGCTYTPPKCLRHYGGETPLSCRFWIKTNPCG